jgi:tRNA (cytidine/uridine-2'-O-)-methyltransferase
MDSKTKFSIVLVNPDIPGNTGSIGRTCVALGIELILIRPYGFDLTEKAVRRAGLDYWKYVDLVEFDSVSEFLEKRAPEKEKLFFFSRFSEQSYFEAKFIEGSYLVFGSETKGLPGELKDEFGERFFSLPMFSDKIRSLNLSNAATAVAYECLRQIGL